MSFYKKACPCITISPNKLQNVLLVLKAPDCPFPVKLPWHFGLSLIQFSITIDEFCLSRLHTNWTLQHVLFYYWVFFPLNIMPIFLFHVVACINNFIAESIQFINIILFIYATAEYTILTTDGNFSCFQFGILQIICYEHFCTSLLLIYTFISFR